MALIPAPLLMFDLDATDAANIGSEWRRWVTRFENFIIAFDVKDDARKRALLLHYAGERIHEISETLPDLPSNLTSGQTPATVVADSSSGTTTTVSTYKDLKDKLDAYFNPHMNSTFEIFQFRQAKQLDGESMSQFSIRLRLLARNCGFANPDLEIKNQIIFATTSSRLRRTALRQDLDLGNKLGSSKMSNAQQQPWRHQLMPLSTISIKNLAKTVQAIHQETLHHLGGSQNSEHNTVKTHLLSASTVVAVGPMREDKQTVLPSRPPAELVAEKAISEKSVSQPTSPYFICHVTLTLTRTSTPLEPFRRYLTVAFHKLV